LEEEKTVGRLSKTLRISGYLVAGGALMGFSIGVYLLFNRALFSFFVGILSFEVMSYFLTVFIPSFAILIVIGYLFATTLGLKSDELSNVVPLCILSLLCMALSALSVFYLISFFGGLLTLTALTKAYTKPTFNTLSKREAFFMVEIGAMFVASFSSLFLLMWLVFQTYAMGSYVSYSPFALIVVGAISFLSFFVIPLWGSRGTNAGFCGAFGLVMSILSYLFVVQNQYVLFNTPAFIGMFMLVLGFVLAVVGELLYVRLFFSEPAVATTVLTSTLLFHGRYCPYCGKPRVTTLQNLCSYCGRSLMWTPYAPFCSSCGLLVPTNAQKCPHCREDIREKRVYFHSMDAREEAIADKLMTKPRKKESWIMKGQPKMARMLQTVEQAVGSIYSLLNAVIERLSLTLRQAVIIIILTYLFGFLSFIGYVRVEPSQQITVDIIVLNYGFPLEWLQVKVNPFPIPHVFDVGVAWASLGVNVVLYFFMSFALVYGVSRLRHWLTMVS